MKSVVVDSSFDWGDDRSPGHSMADTVLYETHVKGLTKRHPDIPPELRGTYAGLAHPVMIDGQPVSVAGELSNPERRPLPLSFKLETTVSSTSEP